MEPPSLICSRRLRAHWSRDYDRFRAGPGDARLVTRLAAWVRRAPAPDAFVRVFAEETWGYGPSQRRTSDGRLWLGAGEPAVVLDFDARRAWPAAARWRVRTDGRAVWLHHRQFWREERFDLDDAALRGADEASTLRRFLLAWVFRPASLHGELEDLLASWQAADAERARRFERSWSNLALTARAELARANPGALRADGSGAFGRRVQRWLDHALFSVAGGADPTALDAAGLRVPPALLGAPGDGDPETLLGLAAAFEPAALDRLFERAGADRRGHGVVYTPPRISAWLVEQTLAPHLADAAPALDTLTVLDPACGAGAFLVAAFDRLHAEHRRRALRDGRPFDAAAAARAIVSNNLFGADLDADAVERARLAIRLRAGASPPNLVAGDSLTGLDWPATFPAVFGRGGFRAIVGNPPYVKLQHFRTQRPAVAAALTAALGADAAPRYVSARAGNFDLYLPFIELGLELLAPDGRMGLIAPSIWTVAVYGRALREKVRAGRHLRGWVDFGSHQVFEGASTYTALQIFGGGPAERFELAFAPDGDRNAMAPAEPMAHDELPVDAPWRLLPGAERRLIDRLAARCARLDASCGGIAVGVQTSADPIYHLERLGPDRYRARGGEPVEVEDALMRPLITGRDVKRYVGPRPRLWLLFPYDISGARWRLRDAAELALRFPRGWAWLGRNEAALRARERGRMDQDDGWWGYNYPKNFDKQPRPKLGIAQTAPDLRVFYDRDGAFFFNNVRVNAVLPRDEAEGAFLLGVLNGPVASFVFRRTAKPKEGGFFEANKQFVGLLPVPPANAAQRAEVGGRALALQAAHTAGVPAADAERALDALLLRLYGLDPGETDLVCAGARATVSRRTPAR